MAVVGLLLIFGPLIGGCSVSLTTDAECKRLGWRQGTVTWRLERFCTSRVEQTDVVVPLAVARERPGPGAERLP